MVYSHMTPLKREQATAEPAKAVIQLLHCQVTVLHCLDMLIHSPGRFSQSYYMTLTYSGVETITVTRPCNNTHDGGNHNARRGDYNALGM